jgi:hypothetical protein
MKVISKFKNRRLRILFGKVPILTAESKLSSTKNDLVSIEQLELLTKNRVGESTKFKLLKKVSSNRWSIQIQI